MLHANSLKLICGRWGRPSRKILHVREVESKSRVGVAGPRGSWGALGRSKKTTILDRKPRLGSPPDPLWAAAPMRDNKRRFIFLTYFFGC